jgi:ubiquinone/menaquinone biosynthesis C-methylase UbiE
MFDMIIDKSTIDAVLCGKFAQINVAIMLKECQRVLKTGGCYVAISYGEPDTREYIFKRISLNHLEFTTVKIERFDKEKNQNMIHYIYIGTKQKQPEENWTSAIESIKKEM